MKESVFIDTGFWIALFDKRDQNHLHAKNRLKLLLQNYHVQLSDFIIFETITYLKCSAKQHDLAVKFLTSIQRSGVQLFVVNEIIKTSALEIFQKYSDKYFSFTDCTSFALMINNKIYKYAGFDDHFQQMGFISAIEKE